VPVAASHPPRLPGHRSRGTQERQQLQPELQPFANGPTRRDAPGRRRGPAAPGLTRRGWGHSPRGSNCVSARQPPTPFTAMRPTSRSSLGSRPCHSRTDAQPGNGKTGDRLTPPRGNVWPALVRGPHPPRVDVMAGACLKPASWRWWRVCRLPRSRGTGHSPRHSATRTRTDSRSRSGNSPVTTPARVPIGPQAGRGADHGQDRGHIRGGGVQDRLRVILVKVMR
jgi:hypothetical protein